MICVKRQHTKLKCSRVHGGKNLTIQVFSQKGHLYSNRKVHKGRNRQLSSHERELDNRGKGSVSYLRCICDENKDNYTISRNQAHLIGTDIS